MIGSDVVVTVLEIRPDLVRIGIKAPRDVEVHREEVWIEVQQANKSAASPSAKDVESLAAGLRDTAAAPPRDASGAAQTPDDSAHGDSSEH